MHRSQGARDPRALLALALLLAPAAAQEPAPDPGPGPETPEAAPQTADDERARELWRIFHLRGGDTLRAKARWRDGRWEVFQDREWRPLDPATIESQRGEREVLADARRLEAELDRDDLGRRVTLARWMLDAGLADESLDQLDRVLREAPDHDAARNVLARHPRLLELPSDEEVLADPGEALRETLSIASEVGPARQELVIRELDRVYGAENLGAVLEHALRSAAPGRRAFGALALRRLLPARALRELYRRAALDPDESVRRAAALAIRDVGQPAVVLPLTRALESDDSRVRTHAAESLGHMGYAAAAPALMNRFANLGKPASAQGGAGPRYALSGSLVITNEVAYVRDFDVEIAQAASIADPIVGSVTEGVVLDVRVGGISGYRIVRERRALVDALERVTGATPGDRFEDWERWWDEHAGELGLTGGS